MKKYNIWLEIITVSILLIHLIFGIILNLHTAILIFALGSITYFVLFFALNFALFKTKINDDIFFSHYMGERAFPSEKDQIRYMNLSVISIGFFRLLFAVIPIVIFWTDQYLSEQFSQVSSVLLIISAFLFLISAINNLMKFHGYYKISFKERILKGLFYNNPEDKRAIVDKPFGYGSTINIGSKQGKLVLTILLAIPSFMIILILCVMIFGN